MYDEDYFLRDVVETWFWRNKQLRPDQLAAYCYINKKPFWGDESYPDKQIAKVFSIGAGRGELEAALEKCGLEVIGVDPTEGAHKLYEGNCLIDEYPGGGDVVLFCESIEHLTKNEFDAIWEKIPKGCWVVIVNWFSYHPLPPNGFDHVRLIDDRFYDGLVAQGRLILRRGSHLVMEKLV